MYFRLTIRKQLKALPNSQSTQSKSKILLSVLSMLESALQPVSLLWQVYRFCRCWLDYSKFTTTRYCLSASAAWTHGWNYSCFKKWSHWSSFKRLREPSFQLSTESLSDSLWQALPPQKFPDQVTAEGLPNSYWNGLQPTSHVFPIKKIRYSSHWWKVNFVAQIT